MTYASTVLADTPQAYYRLNESRGAVAHDSSGNGYDAALSGVTGYMQPGAINESSATSMTFTLSGGLALPYTLNYTTFSALSIEFWMNLAGWYYAVVTCDNATTLVYLDGVASTVSKGTSLIEVASIFDVVSSGIGGLAEPAFYNYVLSPSQVANHYANRTPTQVDVWGPLIWNPLVPTPVGHGISAARFARADMLRSTPHMPMKRG